MQPYETSNSALTSTPKSDSEPASSWPLHQHLTGLGRIRLNAIGWNAQQLAEHFNRNKQSIHNDLDRYELHGIKGLTDGTTTGKPGKFNTTIEAFLKAQLEQDRVWNSSLLRESIAIKFSVDLSIEAIRLKLRELGYSWKRTRYAPGKTPDPAVVAEHKAELEVLKKGHWIKH
jgi:transposase